MKRIFRLLCLLYALCPLLLQSQVDKRDFLILDTSVYTTFTLRCIETNQCVSNYQDEVYYFTPKNISETCFSVFCFNATTNKESEIKIYLDKEAQILNDVSSYPVQDFWIDENSLFVTTHQSIFKFKKYSDTAYKYEKRINLKTYKGFFNTENINESKKLFWGIDDNGLMRMSIYDTKKEKEVKAITMELPIKLLFYFEPRDVVSTNGEQIFFTSAENYKIYIYDLNLDITDSIVFNKNYWNAITREREQQISNKCSSASDIIYDFGDEINGYSSVRRLISFGKNLIVFYSTTQNNKRVFLYDLWREDENKQWSIVAEDVNDYEKGNKKKNKLQAFRKFLFIDNSIYALESGVPVFRENFNSEEKYLKAYEKYQIDNDCVLKIDKLHWE